MEEVIAKLDLVLVRPSGERFPVCVEIGRPYLMSEGSGAGYAACPVSMRGLYKRLPDIHGVDTFQALSLVLHLVRTLLKGFVEDGGRVLYSDGQSDFDFQADFPCDRT